MHLAETLGGCGLHLPFGCNSQLQIPRRVRVHPIQQGHSLGMLGTLRTLRGHPIQHSGRLILARLHALQCSGKRVRRPLQYNLNHDHKVRRHQTPSNIIPEPFNKTSTWRTTHYVRTMCQMIIKKWQYITPNQRYILKLDVQMTQFSYFSISAII